MDTRFIYSNYAEPKVSILTNLIDILLWTWLGEGKKSHKRRFYQPIDFTLRKKKKKAFVD